jgi:hypothetical protein
MLSHAQVRRLCKRLIDCEHGTIARRVAKELLISLHNLIWSLRDTLWALQSRENHISAGPFVPRGHSTGLPNASLIASANVVRRKGQLL